MTENAENNHIADTSTGKNTEELSAANTDQKRTIPIFRVIMIFIIALLIAGGFLLNSKIRMIDRDIQALSESPALQSEGINNRIQKLEERINSISAQTEILRNTLKEHSGQQQPAMNEDWALSEAEYLIVIANHRLTLERDVETAVAAMESALLRLESMDDMNLLPVREQLVEDINRLKAVNTVDITGLSIYLADLIDKANELPVRKSVIDSQKTTQQTEADINESASGLKGFMNSIWQELKSLVVIKKTGEIKHELLLPHQEYFLYQNLRLELESARLSALRRDTENFHTSLVLIMDWLNQFYDTGDSGVMNVLDTLKQMSTVKLDPELPDINSSLETLRAFIHQKDTASLLSNLDKMAFVL